MHDPSALTERLEDAERRGSVSQVANVAREAIAALEAELMRRRQAELTGLARREAGGL